MRNWQSFSTKLSTASTQRIIPRNSETPGQRARRTWRNGMPLYGNTKQLCGRGFLYQIFDGKTVTDEKLRDFSASVQTKYLHAIRNIRIAWRRFLNSVFEYISGVRGMRKFFPSRQAAGQGPGFSSHSDSGFPLLHYAPERIRQCSFRTM